MVSWPHSTSGHFSVKSCYRVLCGGPVVSKFKPIWEARVPPKIKIFMRQALRGRLPTMDKIKKRHGTGSEFCAFCGCLEDTNHILFWCPLAQLFWRCFMGLVGCVMGSF